MSTLPIHNRDLQKLPQTAQQHDLTYKEMRCDARKLFNTVKFLKLASRGIVQLQGIPASR